MLLYRLPIACWRTDERVDSRVLAAVSECSIGTVSEGLGRWRFTCEPARPLCGSWFRCTLERPARSIALLLPRSRGRAVDKSVAHRTCSLGCSRVFNRIFLFTKVSKGSIMPLSHSHSAVFAAREPARPGAAARRCVARRQAGAPRSQRGRSRRRRRGRPGRRSWGPYEHTLVSITFRG